MKKIFLLIIILNLSLNLFALNYKIAVLAKDGKEKCLQDWKSTGDYLNSNIQNHICEIIPIEYHLILPSIENNEIDFIIINPTLYITSKIKYQTKAVATMLNEVNGLPLKEFGGVIFTAADNKNINSVKDIKGKNFVAVSQNSFGGWLMAYKELLENDINPYKNFNNLSWAKKHEFAIMQVLIGEADAGTVRTDTIERMVNRGIIQIDEIKIINQKKYPDFPFLVSTSLYPEWPLLKLKNTDEALTKIVVETLKNMKPSDLAAKSAKIMGWVDPLDYSNVEKLDETFKIGSFFED